MIEAGRRIARAALRHQRPARPPSCRAREAERDLPAARHRPETGHGHKTGQTKEGHT